MRNMLYSFSDLFHDQISICHHWDWVKVMSCIFFYVFLKSLLSLSVSLPHLWITISLCISWHFLPSLSLSLLYISDANSLAGSCHCYLQSSLLPLFLCFDLRKKDPQYSSGHFLNVGIFCLDLAKLTHLYLNDCHVVLQITNTFHYSNHRDCLPLLSVSFFGLSFI